LQKVAVAVLLLTFSSTSCLYFSSGRLNRELKIPGLLSIKVFLDL